MTKKKTQVNPLETLLKNVHKDQEELETVNQQLNTAKQTKQAIVNRLRDYKKDVAVLMKYASDEQKEQLESLGFGNSTSGNTLNPTAQIALDIMTEKKEISNEELYEEYAKAIPKGQEPLNYTQLNIKIRPLFNRNLLIREKGDDLNSSKTDVIRLNG